MKLPEKRAITYCSNRENAVAFQSEKGFSFLELIIVIVIIGLLLTVAVDKLLILKVEAERTSMETIIGNLRSAITLQVANHITKGTVSDLAQAQGKNPMDWLSTRPEGYIGVLNEPDPTDIEPYKWYFDSYNKELVYRVGNADYFESKLEGPARARFKLKLDYTDADSNGKYSPKIDEIHGLTLSNVEPYTWRVEPINVEDYLGDEEDTANKAEKTN